MEKKVQRNFLWIALLVLGTIWILARHNRTQPYYTVNGLIFGTVYNITYQYDGDLKAEIDEELKRFDGSLSPFNDTATITRINRNEDIVPDTFFTNVFRRSMEISKETNGAFDITVAPLANAWGFGFKKGAFPDSAMIDSLLEITGYTKVVLSEEGKVVKQDERMMLSCSSQGICSGCNSTVSCEERHHEFHGRYRRRDRSTGRKSQERTMAHWNQ